MFIFHIDLSLTVAMVTENGRQYRLKYRNIFLDHILEVLRTVFSKLDISIAKYQKYIKIFYVSCYHLSSI